MNNSCEFDSHWVLSSPLFRAKFCLVKTYSVYLSSLFSTSNSYSPTSIDKLFICPSLFSRGQVSPRHCLHPRTFVASKFIFIISLSVNIVSPRPVLHQSQIFSWNLTKKKNKQRNSGNGFFFFVFCFVLFWTINWMGLVSISSCAPPPTPQKKLN